MAQKSLDANWNLLTQYWQLLTVQRMRDVSNSGEPRKKKIILCTGFLLKFECQLTFVSPCIFKNSHGKKIRNTITRISLCAVILCPRHFPVKCCLMPRVFSFYNHIIIKAIQCLKLPHRIHESPHSNLSSDVVSWLWFIVDSFRNLHTNPWILLPSISWRFPYMHF